MFKKVIIAILILGSANFTTFAAAAEERLSTAEKMAYVAKPAVVRIFEGYVGQATWKGSQFTKTYDLIHVGSGSGVIIDQSGYIATNAHVVAGVYQSEEDARTTLLRQYAAFVAEDYGMSVSDLDEEDAAAIIAQFSQTVNMKAFREVFFQNGDKRPFEVKAYSSPEEGKDIAIIKVDGSDLPILKLADSVRVRVQEHISVLGYPSAGDSKALDDNAVFEPSITDGRVSALKKRDNGATVFQVDASATHGNSGGPVVNDNGEVLGLLTFRGDPVNGQEVQGFSFVVASNDIRDLMATAGIQNTGGPDDKAYREGLELYFSGKYRSALAKFETLRSSTQYTEIENLIRECEANKDLESNNLPILIAAAAVVLVLVFLAFLAIVFSVGIWLRRRSKYKAKATPAVAPTPAMA